MTIQWEWVPHERLAGAVRLWPVGVERRRGHHAAFVAPNGAWRAYIGDEDKVDADDPSGFAPTFHGAKRAALRALDIDPATVRGVE